MLRVLAFSILLCFVLGIVVIIKPEIKSVNYIMSGIIGLLMVLILSSLHAKLAFMKGIVVKPREALKLHSRSMLIKFIVNILLFILVFLVYKNCSYFILFVCYFLSQILVWVFLFKTR